MTESLPRVVPEPPGKPVRPEAADAQRESRLIARTPGVWSAGRAAGVVRRYTELAPTWDGERGGYRRVPLADALARGGPFDPGRCIEIGCGTGLLTPLVRGVWSQVACLDLTAEMLRRSTATTRVLADASRLPFPRGAFAAAVLADVPLLAEEVVRVLEPRGVVVWSNALGVDAPHHVPIDAVRTALERASGSPWTAVGAEAGWGLWAVLRRSPARA